ncbi:hypothetical protein QJS10_CPB04g00162 [Acorus calamus]|uniref:Uncharacterized protein n=1 Tax=Acorus calamus TaxID=4465 RepID=A0AAV9EYN1_ACOCL|nr:hypothetical protein QJS10_CPB04g00162 [Acorus calamus]
MEKEHIEEIRRKKFSIGGDPNMLTEDLHQANAEDNEYPPGVDPSLEFIITSKDITSTGALTTLLIFNNEKGFSPKNIDSICGVGRSTKKGNRQRGYIGEKGKLYWIQECLPHNKPAPHLQQQLPNPLQRIPHSRLQPRLHRPRMGRQQSHPLRHPKNLRPFQTPPHHNNHPPIEIRQSLRRQTPTLIRPSRSPPLPHKIKRLSVREDNDDPKLSTVNAISISSETDFQTRKNISAESYTLHLAATENSGGGRERDCDYYMWKQKFPVRVDSEVERRRKSKSGRSLSRSRTV